MHRDFCNWVASSPLASILKTFAAIVFAGAVADFASGNSIDFADWQTWIIAGLVAVVPTVINWLNPADSRYGRGSAE